MSLLLCFSGQIGSGKSSVSTAVAEALGWRRTGFSDYLRSEIKRMGGDPSSREALQDLGQQLVESDAVGFCRAVLAHGGFAPGDNFLIDGIRHVAIFEHLRDVADPSVACLVFLSVDENHRRTRIQDRRDKDDFSRAQHHRVEAELRDELPRVAHALIDATVPFDQVVGACLLAIEGFRRSDLSDGG